MKPDISFVLKSGHFSLANDTDGLPTIYVNRGSQEEAPGIR